MKSYPQFMLCHAVLLLLTVLLGTASCVYGQAGPTISLTGKLSEVENLVRMHDAWGAKTSTPNSSLRIPAFPLGQVNTFRLIADGVSKDLVYTLVTWPINQKSPGEALTGVTLNSSNLAICAGRPGTCGTADKLNDPIDLAMQLVPGEPVRIGLISKDGSAKLFAKVVPVPLRGEDGGCSVEVVLLAPGAQLVLITGEGFPANTEINLDSVSEGQHQGGKVVTDAAGRYSGAISPYRKGVSHGESKVVLKAPPCAPSVNVAWGTSN